jgi:hypothetical protein
MIITAVIINKIGLINRDIWGDEGFKNAETFAIIADPKATQPRIKDDSAVGGIDAVDRVSSLPASNVPIMRNMPSARTVIVLINHTLLRRGGLFMHEI